jgi:hypothetical protein
VNCGKILFNNLIFIYFLNMKPLSDFMSMLV